MATQSAAAIFQNLQDAFRRGDIPAILAYMAPDFVIVEAESLPYGGEFHGPAGFQQLMEQIFAVWERLESNIERVVGEEDDVAVFITISGKLRGVEQPITMPLIEHWRFRDGKAVFCRPFYADTALIARLWAGRAGA
ncbi:MAG TPA: nuclear transport factor 2 family protein [Roseiflexaceae bacterium]|nr:nuclear transport factor 2 family protein [Roseiflexaceae bacterium]